MDLVLYLKSKVSMTTKVILNLCLHLDIAKLLLRKKVWECGQDPNMKHGGGKFGDSN